MIASPRPSGRRTLAVLRPLLAALLLVATLGVAPAPTAVAAATPDLTLVTSATYVADPAHARVSVGVDIVATNHKADTTSFAYYFDNAYLAVLPGASGFTLNGTGTKPSVSVARRTSSYTMLHLVFGTRIRSGSSLQLHLAFALVDKGGAPTRDVRVGQALIQFPVWAFASDATPGSRVTVVIPAGYTVTLGAGDLKGPAAGADGSQVLTSGALADPLSFFAYVTADRPGAYAESDVTATVEGQPASIRLQAWPDDAPWARRTGDLFQRGLPELGTAIGLPYPLTDRLAVRESVSRTLGGYAGIFDPSAGRIDVDFAADPFVVLHEASHVWFNGSLLVDRWANEAFATYYGAEAAKALAVKGGPDALTPAMMASKIPLNAWGAVGQDSQAIETYAYAASAALANSIADRAGASGLRLVWAASSARESAYQPTGAGTVERTDGPPDWRGLLDLLEQKTGQRFDDLWREYVVRPTEAPLLTTRATARTDYAALLTRAADWQLPRSIRSAMTTWRFDAAEGLMTQAGAVLDERTAIATAAAATGLTPPSTLREDFEGDRGLPVALAEGDAELKAIGVVGRAVAARPTTGDPVIAIGLLGSDPEVDLAAAKAAFASGDLGAAVSRSESAAVVWTGARDAGTRRILALGGALLVLLLMAAGLVLGGRSRRRRRSHQQAHRVSVPGGPYATLAGEPPTGRPDGRAVGGGGEGSETT